MEKSITKQSILVVLIITFILINTYSTALASTTEPTLTVNKKTIYVGKKYNIVSMIKNVDKSASLTYKSLDKSLAKVSSKGNLSGICVGKTKVVVEVVQNNKKYTLKLEVIVKEKATPATAFDYSINYRNNMVIDGLADSLNKNIVIPTKIDNKKVKEIGSRAFSNFKSLESIYIPETVTSIGFMAFGGCTSLKILVIPNSVNNLDSFALASTTSLEKVTLSKNITSISDFLFMSASNLKNIVIPSKVTTIGSGAFQFCTSLKDIEIPDNVTEIDKFAFSYCSSLTSVKLSKNLTAISEGAFTGCTELKKVDIPKSVNRISSNAFANNENLEYITIPSSVVAIGIGAFEGCDNLTIITPAKSYAEKYAIEHNIPYINQ